jgi:hypothetical protein
MSRCGFHPLNKGKAGKSGPINPIYVSIFPVRGFYEISRAKRGRRKPVYFDVMWIKGCRFNKYGKSDGRFVYLFKFD